ncbi:unnamed protein product [Moneuplotes crassus]|uniref:Uncharacterized protein n=1 Tax=Euplotes crassus TaxID=5936 RepID=A0AAD2D0X0_EUPCR|nr:unnamed protein product [Moneuplotes crassus]
MRAARFVRKSKNLADLDSNIQDFVLVDKPNIKRHKARRRRARKIELKKLNKQEEIDANAIENFGFSSNFCCIDEEEFKELNPEAPDITLPTFAIEANSGVTLDADERSASYKSPKFLKCKKSTPKMKFLKEVMRKMTLQPIEYDSKVYKTSFIKGTNCNELVLCKTGCYVSKTWIVENCGAERWSTKTTIIALTEDLECQVPSIDKKVYPKEQVMITVVFKVNDRNLEAFRGENSQIIEVKLSLNHPEIGNFGEPLRVYLEVDQAKYDSQVDKEGNGGNQLCHNEYTKVWTE